MIGLAPLFDWRPPVLVTERLQLRPLEASDAAAIFSICSNPNMTRYTLWETHEGIEDSEHYVGPYARSRYVERIPEPMGIVRKDVAERPFIGTVGCFWSGSIHGTMELGYNVGEPWWGHGFAVEAATRLIDHAFENYDVERIQVRADKNNHASIRVAEKLGMMFEGTLRSYLLRGEVRWDVSFFSILRQEWQQRQREPESDPVRLDGGPS